MLTKEEFVKTHPDVRVGMTAYTTDGEKLGVIERIDEDTLLVERGWFFHKDFTISYDDIEDVQEDRVIVRQRRGDFQEQMGEESWEAGESDLTGRAGEMGERMKETGERLGERAKEATGSRGREEEQARIPLREEELEVQKEEVVIERTPVDESRAAEMGGKAFQEEDIRIPLKEEEVEVTKRPVVKEDVSERKESRTETQPVSGAVRKEEVKVSPSKQADKEKK